jgi:hypothetical protein
MLVGRSDVGRATNIGTGRFLIDINGFVKSPEAIE